MADWREYLKNDVFVFSASYCPYCDRVKQVLKSIGVQFRVIECDQVWNQQQIQKLKSESGHSTFPAVFVGKTLLKGCSDVQAAIANGKIWPILDQHGVAYTKP